MSQSLNNKNKSNFPLEILLIVAIAIGIILRIINLETKEFWYDEVLSVVLSTGQPKTSGGYIGIPLSDYTQTLMLPLESNFTDTLGTFKKFLQRLAGDVHPPLYYFTVHLMRRFLGSGEAAVRSVSLLSSLGAIGSAYGIGKIVSGARCGLLLATLLATSPYYLYHSLNARMYGPVVLWVTLSGWAMLELIYKKDTQKKFKPVVHQILWSIILIVSVTAGLLTHYLFAYWGMTLAIMVVILDLRRWWLHGLRLATSLMLAVPWYLWGTRQQIRNRSDAFGQVSQEVAFPLLEHFQEVVQTLGTHLLIGDWYSSLPKAITIIAGLVIILVLGLGIVRLWRQGEGQALTIALLMGVLPLLLVVIVDIVTNKFTIGFGGGRTVIFILPGLLLLLAVWIEKMEVQWRRLVLSVVLLVYLTISIGDFSLRPRRMFHQVAEMVVSQSNIPSLVMINSRAWGHVLRLAYYIRPEIPVTLLDQDASKLPASLDKVLSENSSQFDQVVWVDSQKPLWSDATTKEEREKIQAVLQNGYELKDNKNLSGTMHLDDFQVYLYQKI